MSYQVINLHLDTYVLLFLLVLLNLFFFFFFFNDTATTEIYTLSLHDALPISARFGPARFPDIPWPEPTRVAPPWDGGDGRAAEDRKSTRLNSSHLVISYAVFCLKKKTRWIRTS